MIEIESLLNMWLKFALVGFMVFSGMLHMVSADKCRVNRKEILVEYHFNISLCFHKWPCVSLAESHQRLRRLRPRTPFLWLVAGMRARAFTQVRSILLPRSLFLCGYVLCVIVAVIDKSLRWEYCFRQISHMSSSKADFEVGYKTKTCEGSILSLKRSYDHHH